MEQYSAHLEEMKRLAGEIEREAHKARPDDDRILALRREFDSAEAKFRAQQVQREALLAGRDPATGKPYKRERGHTPKDLDDDPWGEPRSISTRRNFADPWSVLDNEFEFRTAGPAEWRARAISAMETAQGSNDDRRQQAVAVLEGHDDRDGGLSRLALMTSQPAYVSAIGELIRTGGEQTVLTAEEAAAVRMVRSEARAMSLTDNAGGYLVPFVLDAAIIRTDAGSYNPVRRFARRVVTVADNWHGVAADAPAWSFDSEAAEVSDDSPTVAGPEIQVHAMRGFIPFSREVGEDGVNFTAEITRLLAMGRDKLESEKLVTGSGTAEPYGIVKQLETVSGSVVTATTNDSFGLPDLYKLHEALAGRHRANGTWLANVAILNDVRQFDTSGGAALWTQLDGDTPPRLLGRAVFEAEAMDDTYGSGDSYSLMFGDGDSYVVVDRLTSIELIPNLFGANGRPTGQRGVFGWHRMGAKWVDTGAGKLLKI